MPRNWEWITKVTSPNKDEFADDEDVELGIEDQDEAKEAKERAEGKIRSNEELMNSKTAKLIAKGLKKYEGLRYSK